VTHNEAIRALDAVVQLSVLDRDLATPPLSPVDGDRYIIGVGSIGDWAGHEGEVAAFQGNAWMFYPALEGCLAWVGDEDKLLAFDGSIWSEVSGGGGSLNPALLVGVNATADSTNRLSVKSDAVLFSHDDVTPGSGNMRTVINKDAVGDTASILYQTGFGGRAEIGLTGNDDFHFKVSADGSAWNDAMVIDNATGNVGIGTDVPSDRLHVFLGGDLKIENDSEDAVMELVPDDGKALLLSSGQSSFDIARFVTDRKQFGITVNGKNGLRILDTYTRFYNDGLEVGRWIGGKLAVGHVVPSTTLHVDGPARVGSSTVATLPSASSTGEGSMLFVSDETGGAVMAFSDGSD
jgi:hypothetical protein